MTAARDKEREHAVNPTYETTGRLYVVATMTGEKGLVALDYPDYQNLLAHGITIVPVTTRTVQNLIELDQVAQLLARRLGKRVRPNAQRWPKDQHKLHGMLLETMPLSPQHGHRAL